VFQQFGDQYTTMRKLELAEVYLDASNQPHRSRDSEVAEKNNVGRGVLYLI
jgi:hypothetical protein